MANIPQELETQLKRAYSVDELPPLVSFFDKAIPDTESTEKSGRTRFKKAVYMEKINRADRSVFHRKMVELDKKQYPKEWARYTELLDVVENRAPSLMAIPGMDVASYEELKALGLTDCEKLVQYTGKLDDLLVFKGLAVKIMEISDGYLQDRRGVREKRVSLENDIQRSDHRAGRMPWTGSATGAGNTGTVRIESFGTKKETRPEKEGDEEITFTYEFAL